MYVKNYLKFHLVIPILLFTLTYITYGNSLANGLFFDDEELIYKNEYVKQLAFFPHYFTENMIAGAGKISNMYRPILLTSFALDYVIWRGNPFGFHFTNILLHGINGVLIFFLLLRLFQKRILAFFTSVLFLVHPVNSEAVIYASGRTDPLSVFFSLLTFHFFLTARQKTKSTLLFYSLALISFILALLTKEVAVVTPFLLALITVVSEKHLRKKWVHIFHFLFPFFFGSLFYVFLRLTILNFANTLNFYATPNVYSENIMVRFFTFTRVFFEYILLLFFPKDLFIARSVPFVTSFFSPSVFAFFLITFFLFFFSIVYFPKTKLFFFSLFFFFLTLLPVSGIIPINNIIAEHYLYFPSLGFFLFVSYTLTSFLHFFSSQKIRFVFLFIIIFGVFLLSFRTLLRTFDWRDPITFYTRSLTQSPWNMPMRHNLAMAYSENGEYTRAIVEYKKIIEEVNIYPNTHHNLANIYKHLGEYETAEEEYKKAIMLDPQFYFSYYALSDLYEKQGKQNKKEEILKKVQRLR